MQTNKSASRGDANSHPNCNPIKYEEVTASTDLSKIKVQQRLPLFEECVRIMEVNATGNKIQKLIVKNMHHVLKDTLKQLDQLKKERESFPTLQQAAQLNPNTRINYAATLKPKPEYPIIIKNATTSEIDLKKSLYKKLKSNNEVKIKKMKVNKKRMIVQVESSAQQDAVIELMKNNTQVEAYKPRKKVPSVFVKEIDKLDEEEKDEMSAEYGMESFDYKQYIINEIALKNGIKKENIVVKRIINKPNFHTIRAIINLDLPSTEKVLNKGDLTIGYRCCPVEKSFDPMQCRGCFGYGHFKCDKAGNQTCTRDPICCFCSTKLNQSETDGICNKCTDRTKRRIKCANCGSREHPSFSANCPKRIEITRKLSSESSC